MTVDIVRRLVEKGADPAEAEELANLLVNLEAKVISTVHDVNNPLAIISGNAQFLTELAREVNLDGDLAKAIADIEDASQVLASRLQLLTNLKEEVQAVVDGIGCRV